MIRKFKTRTAKEDSAPLETWNEAVKVLQSEDHYILVMTGIADGRMNPAGPIIAGKLTRIPNVLAIGVAAGISALVIMFLILRSIR